MKLVEEDPRRKWGMRKSLRRTKEQGGYGLLVERQGKSEDMGTPVPALKGEFCPVWLIPQLC